MYNSGKRKYPAGNFLVEEYSAGEEILSNTTEGEITETEEHISYHAPWYRTPCHLSYDRPLPPPIAPSPKSVVSDPRESHHPSPTLSSNRGGRESPYSSGSEDSSIESLGELLFDSPLESLILPVSSASPIQPEQAKVSSRPQQGLEETTGKGDCDHPDLLLELCHAAATLGTKRGRSSSPMEASDAHMKHARTETNQSSACSPSDRLWKKYRYDWRVHRDHPPEDKFFPQLFNAARLKYLQVPRKQASVPRNQRASDDSDLGAKYRRDWKVERRIPITRYFNPQLFDPGHLDRVRIPLKRREKKRRFQQHMQQLGITDPTSPAFQLRRNQSVNRTHPVERFFQPALFQQAETPGERLRADWYSQRKHGVDEYFNPMLVNENYARRKAHNVHFMLLRLHSTTPWTFRSAIKKTSTDPGQHYRDDWRVHRANDLLLYWDSSLFAESDPVKPEATKNANVGTKCPNNEVNNLPVKELSKVETADLGAKYRQDWRVHRANDLLLYWVPDLFSEQRAREEADYWNFLINLYEIKLQDSRAKEELELQESPRKDLGRKYREDWQVKRANDLLLHWDPTIFDEKEAHDAQDYWQLMLDRYNYQKEHQTLIKEDLGLKYRRDWQVKRPFDLLQFWDPLLFEEEPPRKNAHDSSKARTQAPFSTRPYPAINLRSSSPNVVQKPPKITTMKASLGRSNLREPVPAETPKKNISEPQSPFWSKEFLAKVNMDRGLRDQILSHIRDEGVPSHARRDLWCALSDNQDCDHLISQYELLAGLPSLYEDAIAADVDLITKSWQISSDQAVGMHFVLSAYANYDSETGYVSSLTPLVATLLRELEEDMAFVMLVTLMEHYNHRRNLEPRLKGCGLLLYQMEQLLLGLDPQLALHLANLGVEPSAYAQDWYSSLMANCGPEFHARVLDLFLLEGYSVLHQIGLVWLIENRSSLLCAHDFSAVMAILQGDLLAAHLDWSHAEWIRLACSLFVSHEELESLEASFDLATQIRDETDSLQYLGRLEASHDALLGDLQKIMTLVREVCLDREALAVQLVQSREEARLALDHQFQDSHRIREMEREMAQQEAVHEREVGKLTTVLNSHQQDSKRKRSSLGEAAPIVHSQQGEKIFRI